MSTGQRAPTARAAADMCPHWRGWTLRSRRYAASTARILRVDHDGSIRGGVCTIMSILHELQDGGNDASPAG